MKRLTALLMVLIVMCFASDQADAETSLINIQFGRGLPENIYYGGGVVNTDPTLNLTWNQVNDTYYDPFQLLYSDGDESNAYLSVDVSGEVKQVSSSSSAIVDTDPTKKLMLGHLSSDADYYASMTITGLKPGLYNIYIYSQGVLNVPSELSATATVTGGSYNIHLESDGLTPSLLEGTNWLMLPVVISDGNFSMSVNDLTIGTLNGVQIEAVPEPGSVILVGIGGIIVFWRFRMNLNKNYDVNA
ncbi:PEP-CTERM sorting domain-containing protein [Chlorobaculum sp. 24CR]|uniref:PEP-CTERM sorting domain-containing protein n=1 Tax=Chlorobaculum sp. 24CR TaxID=2508878 RepID=UPI001431B40C|nr:PEP-CTERM sorting domain-containing protein [Chlorobaculum sp. 24CR]